MFPHVDMQTVMLELDEERHRAARHRRSAPRTLSQASRLVVLRYALGRALLGMGALLLGHDGQLDSDAAGGDPRHISVVPK